jgi:hypothetical protein
MVKIFTLFLLVGYGLLITGTGLRQLRQDLISSWQVFGLLLGSTVILVSAYLLYIDSFFTMGASAAGLLTVHILAIFNSRQIHGRINWPYQAGRAFILLFLLFLVYFALN